MSDWKILDFVAAFPVPPDKLRALAHWPPCHTTESTRPYHYPTKPSRTNSTASYSFCYSMMMTTFAIFVASNKLQFYLEIKISNNATRNEININYNQLLIIILG